MPGIIEWISMPGLETVEGPNGRGRARDWGTALLAMALAAYCGGNHGFAWGRQVGTPSLAADPSLVRLPDLCDGVWTARASAVPLLGELLVFELGLISARQLEDALDEQLCGGSARCRLGDILVRAGRLTEDQLRVALQRQGVLPRFGFGAHGLAASARP
jgi:hypothetical protein